MDDAVTLLTEGDLLGLAGVYGYVAAVIALSWALKGKIGNPRKLVHILTGGIVFFWWAFDTREIMAGLAAAPFVGLLLLCTPMSPIKCLRDSPLGSRSAEGHQYGLVMYAASWTVLAYVLFEDLFAASIAIAAMSFGDGMGELIGRRYGRRTYLRRRTVEGSLAVFAATFIAVLVLDWFYFGVIGYSGGSSPDILILFARSLAGMVTCLEAVTPGQVDNLVIPLVVGGYLHVLGV
jgi:dolichol kinase